MYLFFLYWKELRLSEKTLKNADLKNWRKMCWNCCDRYNTDVGRWMHRFTFTMCPWLLAFCAFGNTRKNPDTKKIDTVKKNTPRGYLFFTVSFFIRTVALCVDFSDAWFWYYNAVVNPEAYVYEFVFRVLGFKAFGICYEAVFLLPRLCGIIKVPVVGVDWWWWVKRWCL